ncbi:hypothetical protein, partial [Victivallis vadensis]|uniref:hypothetical protein n=1 Tax=Victivallis vadensis TaxID=172901 RepID=UPI003AF528B0
HRELRAAAELERPSLPLTALQNAIFPVSGLAIRKTRRYGFRSVRLPSSPIPPVGMYSALLPAIADAA